MGTRELHRGTDPRALHPGEWWPLGTDAGLSAVVACPDCGREATLTGHAIASDGAVSPSLVCPYDGSAPHLHPACRFHAYVVLVDWVR
jgi:hypothetical protein